MFVVALLNGLFTFQQSFLCLSFLHLGRRLFTSLLLISFRKNESLELRAIDKEAVFLSARVETHGFQLPIPLDTRIGYMSSYARHSVDILRIWGQYRYWYFLD